MPEYERSEVASSDMKQKVMSEGFYNGDRRKKRRNPAQILKFGVRNLRENEYGLFLLSLEDS